MKKGIAILFVFVAFIIYYYCFYDNKNYNEIPLADANCRCKEGETRVDGYGDYCYTSYDDNLTSDECYDANGRYIIPRCYFGWHNICSDGRPVNGITLDKKTITVKVGEEFTLTAIFDPIDTTNQTMQWSYEGVGIKMMYPNYTNILKAIATTPGKGEIIAIPEEGKGISATCEIIVTADDNNNTNVWYKDFYYELDNTNNTITLYKYNGGATNVYVPNNAIINGKKYDTLISSECLLNKDHYLFFQNTNIISVEFEQGVKAINSLEFAFSECANLRRVIFNGLDTTKVTKMTNMFNECSSLVTLDLSSFNTSNVTTMSEMFAGCNNLVSIDLSNFNTSKVTNMATMFYGCNNLANLNLSSFDTSNVTNMEFMFYGLFEMTTLDLRSFDTSNVINMMNMFGTYNSTSNSKLTTIYVSSHWNTNKVTKSDGMFIGQKLLVGGAGTVYNANKIDKEYARIDKSGMPGYFTEFQKVEIIDKTNMAIVNDLFNVLPKFNEILTVSIIKNNLRNNDAVTFYDVNDKIIESESEKIGTGFKVQFNSKKYIIVLFGDVNGDGEVSLVDVAKAYSFMRGKTVINKNYELNAIDVTGDNKQTLVDVSKIYSFAQKKINSL